MLKRILQDPAWFPDRIDPRSGRIRFVATSREIIESSTFLDGRTSLERPGGDAVIADLEGVVELSPPPEDTRWIFHMSFCGSTLLAKMCAAPGKALCLREPQVLTDLASWKARMGEAGRRLYDGAVSAVLGQLGKGRAQDEALLIKPSNWVNSALDDLWRPERGDRAVIVDIDVRRFLVAVLRGGRPRIEYTLRLGDHLARSSPPVARLAAELTDDGPPFVRAMRQAALAHWVQHRLFEARCRMAGIDFDTLKLDYPDLAADGVTALSRVSEQLDLGFGAADIADSVARHGALHAKNGDGGSSWNGEESANAAVLDSYRDVIGEALRVMPILDAESPSMVEQMMLGMDRYLDRYD